MINDDIVVFFGNWNNKKKSFSFVSFFVLDNSNKIPKSLVNIIILSLLKLLNYTDWLT